MARRNVYVVRRGDQWAVVQEGAERASSLHDTQREAIDRAQPIVERQRGELRIQGRDGKFRDSDSHGNDPHPPKDAKH
jgi:uncharacterized protein YdaT